MAAEAAMPLIVPAGDEAPFLADRPSACSPPISTFALA
jgi:hypothetical protein